MSIKQMAEVWTRKFTSAERDVVLVLADHGDDYGRHIFPSVALIAWKTDSSTRKVQRVLSGLRDRGILVVVSPARQHRPTEYRLNQTRVPLKEPIKYAGDAYHRDDKLSPLEELEPAPGVTESTPGVTNGNPGVTESTPRGDIAMSPKPPLEPPITKPSYKPPLPEIGGGLERAPELVRLSAAFVDASGIDLPIPETSGEQRKLESDWWGPLRQMVELANGGAVDLLTKTVVRLRSRNMSVYAPSSCLKTFISLHGESKTKPSAANKYSKLEAYANKR